MRDFNLEDVYGSFLEALERHISEIDDEPIRHYGVKGMKWGVRKDRSSGAPQLRSLGPDKVVRKTASGEEITMTKQPPTAINRLLGRMSEKYRENYANQAYLSIQNSSGKKIGEAQVSKKSNDELNLVWLSINRSSRGQGYATAVMKAGAEFGRQEGFKRLTLEVPRNSPDARHIYEKLGFKVVKEPTAKEIEEDPVFGGLTEMVYEVNESTHGLEVSMSYLEKPSTPGELLRHDSLKHYGVKGMRWGVRKKEPFSLATGYSQKQYDSDVRLRGRSSANRINERVKKGQNVHNARAAVANRRALLRLAAFGGAFVALHLAQAGSVKIQDRAFRNRQAAGAKAAANLFADKRGIPSYSTINATFNPATGVWG